MPAGKPNIIPELADLESFIIRKNLDLQNWMQNNSIKCNDDINQLIANGNWRVSTSLINKMQYILSSMESPLENNNVDQTDEIDSSEKSSETEQIVSSKKRKEK